MKGKGEVINWKGNSYTEKIGNLYNQYYQSIYQMAFIKLGRNHDSAEEVAQETWLAIMKSIRNFKGDSSLETWIRSIANHKITDFQRRAYNNISNLSLDDESVFIEPSDTNLLPYELAEQREIIDLVHNALNSLPKQYRMVLTLKYLDQLTSKEAGKVMGRTTKAVESMLDRAREAMRFVLSPVEEEQDAAIV